MNGSLLGVPPTVPRILVAVVSCAVVCLGGVTVLSSGVLAVFRPAVSRSCTVFHAVATTISENLRLWGGRCPVGEEVGRVVVGWWCGARR